MYCSVVFGFVHICYVLATLVSFIVPTLTESVLLGVGEYIKPE